MRSGIDCRHDVARDIRTVFGALILLFVTTTAALALTSHRAGSAPTTPTAYVTNGFSNTVTPIDTATGTAGTPIPVGDRPEGIAITPNGSTVYVTNTDSDAVTPIAAATNTPGTPIPSDTTPKASPSPLTGPPFT